MKPISLLFAALLLAVQPGMVVRAQNASGAGPAPGPTTNAVPVAEKADVVVKAAVKPAATAVPERNIRFQFDGIPYSDVIDRFSQMAAKPLLADTNIVGTLTYDDPNAYSYLEALDTLNQILALKGVMLLEDGKNLRLVPFKQLPSMPIRILHGT